MSQAQRVVMDWRGIESTPGVCGGDPCVAGTRIPVWVLEQARSAGASDADLLAWYPSLRAKYLTNVWAYVTAHLSEVQQLIRENAEA